MTNGECRMTNVDWRMRSHSHSSASRNRQSSTNRNRCIGIDHVRLRPPASSFRVLAARRGLPDRRTARQGGRAEDAGDGDHRARQHVLVGRLPRPGAQARDQPDPRLRGLRRAGRSAHQERHAGRNGEPPRPPRRDQRGVPQPHQAGVVGLHRGLLLQAAHRQGAARAAREGADRPEQLPEGRSRDRHPHRAAAEGDRGGGRLSRHPRPRELLPRDAVPGHRRAARSSTSACSRSRRTSASTSSSPTTSTT